MVQRLLVLAFAAAWLITAPAQALTGTRGVSLIGLTQVARADGGYAYTPLPVYGPAMYARLRASGVDLVRLAIRPLPLMVGTRDAQTRARAQVLETVRQLTAARITTIVDLHPWPPDTPDEESQLICTPEGAALLERVLLALAVPLARMPSRVGLELLNEPKRCEVDGQMRWPRLQQHLVHRIRAVAPALPLVVTPPAGQLDDLLTFDAKPYVADPNILFSFHFYEPFIFTTPIYFKAEPVPFPSPGGVMTGEAAFARADRSKMSAQHSSDLWHYLTRPYDERMIAARFGVLDRWRRAVGISARRVVLGEYGIVRTSNTGSMEDYRNSAHWLAVVTRTARRSGIRPIFWLWPAKPNFLYDPQARRLRKDIADAIDVSIW